MINECCVFADYPTDEELKMIERWAVDTDEDARKLLDFVCGIWHWGDFVYKFTNRFLTISTGGWSGNESIIEALQQNKMFWWNYWYMEKVGGHYWFRLTKNWVKDKNENTNSSL